MLATEGLALTGAWVDKEQGLISLIALEMGSSSRLCATWKPGDPLVVMGVTGAPTDIHSGQTVLLIGGGLGNAVLFSIGKALRAAGNQVIYFAGYRNREDVFKVDEIEAASDLVVWSVDKRRGAEAIEPRRPQDKTFVGNILEAMLAYARGRTGRNADSSRRCGAPHRHRLRPYDGGGEGGPLRRAEALSQAAPRAPSARSTRRCSA